MLTAPTHTIPVCLFELGDGGVVLHDNDADTNTGVPCHTATLDQFSDRNNMFKFRRPTVACDGASDRYEYTADLQQHIEGCA